MCHGSGYGSKLRSVYTGNSYDSTYHNRTMRVLSWEVMHRFVSRNDFSIQQKLLEAN